MIKSTSAYFDTDKLYIVRPSIVRLNNNKCYKFEQDIQNIDIAFINDRGVYGLIKGENYCLLDVNNVKKDKLYVNVFDNDLELLVEYLFKGSMDVELTTEIINRLFKGKPYYEIDELKKLYSKIIKKEEDIDDTKKVKQMTRF